MKYKVGDQVIIDVQEVGKALNASEKYINKYIMNDNMGVIIRIDTDDIPYLIEFNKSKGTLWVTEDSISLYHKDKTPLLAWITDSNLNNQEER